MYEAAENEAESGLDSEAERTRVSLWRTSDPMSHSTMFMSCLDSTQQHRNFFVWCTKPHFQAGVLMPITVSTEYLTLLWVKLDLVTRWCILSSHWMSRHHCSWRLRAIYYRQEYHFVYHWEQVTLTRRGSLIFSFLPSSSLSFSDMEEVMKEKNPPLMFFKVVRHLVECNSIWCLAPSSTTPVIQQAPRYRSLMYFFLVSCQVVTWMRW